MIEDREISRICNGSIINDVSISRARLRTRERSGAEPVSASN